MELSLVTEAGTGDDERSEDDLPFLWLLDRIAIVAAAGGAFIRLGNFFNSEIYGYHSTLPWAVIFSRVDAAPRHPSQLYEAILCLITCLILAGLYSRFKDATPAGLLSGIFLTLIFTARFFLEFLKVPQAAYITGLGLNTGQLISIPFIISGLLLVIKSVKRHHAPLVL